MYFSSNFISAFLCNNPDIEIIHEIRYYSINPFELTSLTNVRSNKI